MRKTTIISSDAPSDTGPYSPAIGAGGFVFVSGQGPLHPQTHEIQGTTIEEQTRYTLNNIKALLEAADASMDDVVKVNAYLANAGDFDKFSVTYAEYFPRFLPARTTVGCGLVEGLVEIDCVAYIGSE